MKLLYLPLKFLIEWEEGTMVTSKVGYSRSQHNLTLLLYHINLVQ